MRLRKIISAVSVILCLSVLFSTASAVQPLADNSGNAEYILSAETEPQDFDKNATYEIRFIFAFMREEGSFGGKIKKLCWYGGKYKILSQEEYYSKVKDENGDTGYIFTVLLRKKGESSGTDKFSLNRYYDQVYVGADNNNRTKALNTGSYSVTWKSSDTSVFTVDSTGLIKGVSPGKATLYVTCKGKTETATIYCIYKWKSSWTGKATVNTYIKAGFESSSGTLATLPSGGTFVVSGDDGGSEGWAYGVYTLSSGKAYWGFVKIKDISTKGTVSQYNSMGWSYPIKNSKFKYISSPYGWRSSGRHLGMDISKGSYSTISGEELVAAFDGKVVWLNDSYSYSSKEPDYGYCIIIESDNNDPVSGNKIRAVYMHMLGEPLLSVGDKVESGTTILGEVGSTGYSTGPHLHFEVNNCNKNFAGSTNSDSFDKTINPTFFYLNKGLGDSDSSTDNEYWYNDNK